MATTIDAAWLASASPPNGIRYGVNGPWGLTLASETYTLTTNITADGTALIVKANGITIDLNGQTITFGNATQPALLNSFFSDNVVVPGLPDFWDVTGASAASVVALSSVTSNSVKNGYAGWATNVLVLTSMSTVQVIKSATFTLPTANIEYCASVFAKAIGNAFSTGINLRIQVIDSVTGVDIALVSPAPTNKFTNTGVGIGSGASEPYFFTPSTVANPVYLQITVTPPTGLSTTVYLSRAEVKTSRNHGIVATGGFSVGTLASGSISSGLGLLPYQLWTQYTIKTGPTTIIDTPGTGNIVCGQATPASSSIWIKSHLSTITGIHAQSDGMDSVMIDADNSTTTISTCVLTDAGTAISNRQRVKGSINLQACGVATITNNTLTGCKHAGIFIASPATGSVITGNTIIQNSRYTNGYGVDVIDTPAGLEISNNTITPTLGRGIIIDQAVEGSVDVQIFGNVTDVYEKANLEFSAAELQCTALRIRISVAAQLSTGLRVYNNTFRSRTDANGAQAAIGMVMSATSRATLLDAEFDNNVFQGVNDSTSSVTSPIASASANGIGCALSTIPSGGVLFTNNTFKSNLNGLTLGDVDGFGGTINNITFKDNTIERNTVDGYQGAGFNPLIIGASSLAVANTDLFGFSFNGTSAIDYSVNATWDSTAAKSKVVDVGWLIDVAVTSAVTGLPIAGATVVVKNMALVTDDTQTTDAGGLTTVTAVTDNWNQPGANPVRAHSVYSPHTLSVSATGYTSQEISLGTLSANTSRSFALSPVGPPPNLAGFRGLADFTGYSVGTGGAIQALAGMQDILDFVGYRTGAVGEVALGGFYGCFDFVGYGSGIPPIPPTIFLLGNIQRNVLITSNAQRSIKLTGEGRAGS